MKDSKAVVEANKLLTSDTATAADFKAAWRSINDEVRKLDALPSIANPSEATSLEERHRLEEEHRERQVQREVFSSLQRRLRIAEERAKASEAVEGAEDARESLAQALEQAQRARLTADKLAGEALAQAEAIAAAKAAAGNAGRGKVGAPAAALDQLAELAGHLVNRTELNRVTHRAALEG